MLLVASVGAYVIIFAWPWTQHMFKLDSSNWDMNVVAFIAAACGIAGVEIVSRLLPRLVGDRDSGHIDGAERESLA